MTEAAACPARNLTDADIDALASSVALKLVKPVAAEIKSQIVTDMKLEVGGGVFVFVKRAIFMVLLSLAIIGAAHSYGFIDNSHH